MMLKLFLRRTLVQCCRQHSVRSISCLRSQFSKRCVGITWNHEAVILVWFRVDLDFVEVARIALNQLLLLVEVVSIHRRHRFLDQHLALSLLTAEILQLRRLAGQILLLESEREVACIIRAGTGAVRLLTCLSIVWYVAVRFGCASR